LQDRNWSDLAPSAHLGDGTDTIVPDEELPAGNYQLSMRNWGGATNVTVHFYAKKERLRLTRERVRQDGEWVDTDIQ